MKILLVGGLSVNPERFLPVIAEHEVYGIWESSANWSDSLKAGGPYKEIKTIRIEDIGDARIDVVWSLISPWDGLRTCVEIKEKWPSLPIVKQVQGGATPWWHSEKEAFRRTENHRHPNYDFQLFSSVLESSAGLMFNAERYRDCLIDQGVRIQNIPYLICNGMAFNYDLAPEVSLEESSFADPHIALIGRDRFDLNLFEGTNVHVHCYTTSRINNENANIHKEKYLGDIAFLRQNPISITDIFEFKKKVWYREFKKYDAGLMHLFVEDEKDVFHGIDINIPGRVNTYFLAGLPPVIPERPSSILDFLAGTDCYVSFRSKEELIYKLNDRPAMFELKKQVHKVRYRFSMQYELPRINHFIESLL